MACINPNSPEFKAALERTGGNPLLAEIELDEKTVKPGVEELFNSNPELASVGTPEQYSQYLDTIFPESKVKDIVYHGGPEKITTRFKNAFTEDGNFFRGIFFSNSLNYIKQLGKKFDKNVSKITSAIINSIDNFQVNEPLQYNAGQYWYFEQYDSIQGKDAGQEVEGDIFAVHSPEQIHILGNEQDVEGFKKFVAQKGSQPMMQLEGTEVGTASPKTLAMIKDFLRRVGVDIKVLQKVVVNGKPIGANGAAFLMQKLVQVAEGKEAQALPEEAMHFAVAIIKQTDPALYKKLLSEINSYRILKDVFATYSSDPNYQTKEGKPDVAKLKEEAIGKLLTQIILQKGDAMMETAENVAKAQSWWQRIIQAIKNLIPKSGFDRLAMDIVSGKNIGTAKDIREEQDAVMLQKDPQAAVIDKLKEISSKISKKDEKYQIDGKTINRRVTDLIKDWYTRRFNNKDLIKSEFQTAVDDLKKEKGTAGHADFEKAFEVFVDEDGLLRDTPLDDSTYVSKINPNNRDMYELLKENMRIRLNSFPKGTKFLKEITVYDPNRSLAGTIDFLAITPEGKVNILDWKFMNLNVEKYEMEGKIPDVPWYKVSAWRQQMEQYKLILQNVYGVDPQNFEQTRMIPIQATYSKGDAKANILPELLSIKIGDVDVKNIKEDYLIPVGLEEEKTGIKKIDDLIEKLNAVYKLLSEKKVTPDQKREKAEQLNSLFYAIRQLQMKQNVKPLIDQATILNKEIQKTIQMYDAKFKGKDPNIFFEKEIDEFAEELQSAQDAIKTYVELDIQLRPSYQGDTSDEAKEIKAALRDVSDDARDISSSLNDILNEYTSEVIAKRERIKSLLSPEKVVRGITRLFASTSTIQLNAMHVLYRKANKAFTYAGYDTNTENNRLIGLKSAYDKWASSKGLNKKNYFSYIKKKGSNELIDEFNPEFYSQLKRKIDEKDTEWIIENINVREYNEELKKQLEKEFEYIENKSRAGTEDQIEATIRLEKAKARQLYDTSTLESPGWLLYDYIKKFPKRDKWESKEWKELNKPENKPALDFYNYIKERNVEYRDLGYINRADARTFLPYVEKGLVEKLIVGGNVKLGEQFFRGISIDSRDTGYGRINPLDGKPVDSIPKYFTEEIEGEVSEDLFRTIALYNEAAIRYKYVSEIENQVRALVRVERNKKAIATSRFGKTVMKDGVLQYNPNNDQNAQLVEDMMKAIVYGQRYLESETFDQLLGKIGNWGGKINEKLGMKVFPENLSDKQVSVNKIIDNLNNSFQISTLGLNVLSATSNFFGGTAQSVINAGKYFTKTDFIKAETMLFVDKLNALGTREEKKKLLAALEYFLPLTENYNREIANKLSISKLNDQSIQDFLMVLMRKGDLAVQTANFYAFLNNTIVENGQVINVREHLRNQPKYKDRYAKSADVREQLDEEFENDVKKLMDEKGVLKTAQLVDNKLVIPGVERKSESVVQLRRDVQQMSKDALGNLTEDDLRKINMNIYGKSFMVFKNWIPRQIDVRMGNIKYNSARDAYEWGRMRSVFNVIAQDWFRSAANLRNSLIANEKGVEFLRELFEKKKIDYKNDTGKELDMTEDEFMDLVRQNIRNQMYDLILLTTIFLLVAALKANMPDDEEDPAVKAQYRFVVKMADKFKDELMYFYDPTSFQNLISKGIFPSVSLIENARKAMGNFFIENWAIATGDEKTVEDTKVIKYWMKTFPVTNQVAGYLPMFFPELAKDLGLKIQSNYGIR